MNLLLFPALVLLSSIFPASPVLARDALMDPLDSSDFRDLLPQALDVVDPALRKLILDAVQAEESGDLRKAEALYRLVLMRDSTLAPAVLGLGLVLVAQGRPDEADSVWDSLPNDADVVEARAALLENTRSELALELYRRLETLELGSPRPYLRQAALLAETDPVRALDRLETYLGLVDGQPDMDVVMTVALGLKEGSMVDPAIRLLQAVRERWPDSGQMLELDAILDRIAVEEKARRMTAGGGRPLQEAERVQLDDARRLAASGRLQRAREQLLDLVGKAPRSAEAWAALGDVNSSLELVAEAERAYITATTLSPEVSGYHASLGTLLARRYGGRRHREARIELGHAIELHPTLAGLYFLMGTVLQESGDFPGAISWYRDYLERGDDPAKLREAGQRLEDLSRKRPELESLPLPAPSVQVPPEAWQAYQVARVYRERGELETARQELEKALGIAPDMLDAHLLLAALDLQEDRVESAMQRYRDSLSLAPGQPQVLLALAELERSLGDITGARDHFQGAASAGAPEAWYFLASLAMDDGRPWTADEYLDRYFESATGGLVHESAVALRDRVSGIIRVYQAVAFSLALLVATAVSILLFRRLTGASLEELLRREPSAFHDVSRVLSSIRHEVLKHNTTLLDSLTRCLESGDLQAASYACDRLFGKGGQSGVLERFQDYVNELRNLGRTHGLRLNLRVKDPVLSPMLRAVKQLERSKRRLLKGGRQADSVMANLERISYALNVEGYEAIGSLLATLCVLRADADFFISLYERVSQEPALEGKCPRALEVPPERGAVLVRVYHKDMEDITINLFRNALTLLSEELPLRERRVGLEIREEADPITGLETVAFRFLDNAPSPLTDAILRGSRIERGLGIAAALLSRNGGFMKVEEQPGWSKAVVVRLPRAETPVVTATVGEGQGKGAGQSSGERNGFG